MMATIRNIPLRIAAFVRPPIPALAAALLSLLILSPPAVANTDVYSALPADTRIIQFALADLDGDNGDELAVLYTTGGQARLCLFQAEEGHWVKWFDDHDVLARPDKTEPVNMEAVDSNGDGVKDVIVYYMTEGGNSMTARLLAVNTGDHGQPSLDLLLEDTTAPPGYPLLGTEGGGATVTFMRMASPGADGFRRVYCWKDGAFERCREVIWEKP